MKYSIVFSAIALAAGASAQQSQWGQCGGVGWTGPTSCSAGLFCSTLNPYYFQCLSGSGGATTTTAGTSTSRTVVTTTSSTRTTSTSTGRTTSTSTVRSTTSSSSTRVTSASGTVTNAGNPFAGKTQYANPFYSSEVVSIAVPSLIAAGKTAQASAAAKVANVPTYLWFDTIEKAKTFPTYLADIRAKNAAGANLVGTFIVYDLPDRDCAALASNGELLIANNGVARYKSEYIDVLVAAVKQYSDVPLALIIEPDSLANLITNMSTAKCANAASAYKECVTYAIQKLNLPNVSMYLDAGHAGWLGWSANIGPAATMFGDLYKAAGSPAAVRGLATNVANYNAFSISSCPSYTSGAPVCDENSYINNLAPLLANAGYPQHFIVDQGRSGKQPTGQQAWGDWCNAIGTGFGMRPGTSVSNSYVDAIVWAKPGGECDGTSNTSAVRYDAHCGYSDALKPAPEAGQWFQAYFEQLLTNANPAF